MKKLLFLLIPVAIGCHTQTPEEKMKEGIKAYLSKTMHDFKSYEPVEYKKIDSVYTSYITSERGSALYDSIDFYTKMRKEILERAKEYTYTSPRVALSILDKGKVYSAKPDSIENVIDKETAAFVKKFNGYKMVHTFRGKNMNNATIITTKRFYFDSAFTVTKSVEVE
jgi:hypothetical protein